MQGCKGIICYRKARKIHGTYTVHILYVPTGTCAKKGPFWLDGNIQSQVYTYAFRCQISQFLRAQPAQILGRVPTSGRKKFNDKKFPPFILFKSFTYVYPSLYEIRYLENCFKYMKTYGSNISWILQGAFLPGLWRFLLPF